MNTQSSSQSSQRPRATNGTNTSTTNAEKPPTLTLDALAAMTATELTEVYRGGSVPESLDALSGLPACRMLAIRGLPRGMIFERLRALAASRRFPWAGKTFEAHNAGEGKGINRIRLLGGKTWFPFDTRIEPSAIDGKPCILLDYDKPENPRLIRMIRDELRQVSPGLFLGPAMLDDQKAPPRLMLYFACDNR